MAQRYNPHSKRWRRTKLSTLQKGFDKIKEAFSEDFVEKYKSLLQIASERIEDRYCICGENVNEHDDGEGGSPSKCEDENCLCSDYHYSLIRSLLKNRDDFIQYDQVKNYPLLPLLVVLQSSGFDSEYLEFFNDYYLWNGDPTTKPKKNEEQS